MSKGYKKEYIDKVRAKFYDIQSDSSKDNRPTGKQPDNKNDKVCKSNGVARLG